MGQKVFRNNTQYHFSIELTVRNGDVPGHVAYLRDFNLNNGQQLMYDYGSYPYLDGISVTTTDNGGFITTKHSVTIRGSSVDNDLNTKDTITIDMENNNVILSYSNTWTL